MELVIGCRYKFGKKIGEGTFGEIFIGTDINSGSLFLGRYLMFRR